MVEELLSQILAETYTQSEALQRLRALRDLILFQLFGASFKNQAEGPSVTNQQTGWLALLKKDIFKQFNKDNVYQIFADLEKKIKDIHPLTIFIPFELSEQAIGAIGLHSRKLFGNNFLVEFKIDPSLIAGTAISWKGIYKDYSIKQKIFDNREKILDMLKAYLNNNGQPKT